MNVKTKQKKSNASLLWLFITVVIIGAAGYSGYSLRLSPIQSASAEEITVYKSPTCGCCKKWVSHLEVNDFDVNAYNRTNLAAIKQQFNIPLQLQSCHTAIVGGYVIEGHVPAEDIKRLLTEKPDIHGLTVPGMPMGSPGMEGPRKDSYQVLAIDKQGTTSVYSQH